MSLTRIKQKLGIAANPMANDFRLRPNHRCYPPSYPHLPGGGSSGSTASAKLTPVAVSHLFDNVFKLATPLTMDNSAMVFLNGILLLPAEDYVLQGERIKVHPADPQDTVLVFVADGSQSSGGTDSQPDPYLDQPVPLDELRYTLAPGGTPYTSTNKDTALIGTNGQVGILEAGLADGYCYTRFDGTLVKLDGSVFFRYKSLLTMRLPDSVERIGNSCFQESAIQRLDAGRGLRTLGYGVFRGAGQLCELVLPSERHCAEIPNMDVLPWTNPELRILVPSSMLETYRAHPVWGDFQITTIE